MPLVLADLHHSLAAYQKLNEAPEYWHKPGVWEDIHSSYERFFELNPDNYGYRHDYARDAYWCGRYQDFLVQAQKFPWTNFQFFGGRAEFDKMVARASTAKSISVKRRRLFTVRAGVITVPICTEQRFGSFADLYFLRDVL